MFVVIMLLSAPFWLYSLQVARKEGIPYLGAVNLVPNELQAVQLWMFMLPLMVYLISKVMKAFGQTAGAVIAESLKGTGPK
jgi:hypothetical protein